jgi:hypothetical protein
MVGDILSTTYRLLDHTANNLELEAWSGRHLNGHFHHRGYAEKPFLSKPAGQLLWRPGEGVLERSNNPLTRSRG